MELLNVDNIEYVPWLYQNEDELESLVVDHLEQIFGKGAIYFSKKKLTSLAGVSSIPDGFVVDFRNKRFFLVEIELAKHDPYTHTAPQLSKFIGGLQNPITRRQIVKGIDKEIDSDPVTKLKLKIVVGEEIYKFLDNLVPESRPTLVVIIDGKTKELEETCSHLPADVEIVEFKTFVRADVRSIKVHAHLFAPLYYEEKPAVEEVIEPVLVAAKRAKRGERTNQKVYYIPILESLIELGGSGKKEDVVNRVGTKMSGILKAIDYERTATHKESRWENTACWARNDLKSRGLLKRGSPTGIWEITDEGRKYYEENKDKWRETHLK